jgi:hypothetical protein
MHGLVNFKFKNIVLLVGFTIEIYYDAWSYKCEGSIVLICTARQHNSRHILLTSSKPLTINAGATTQQQLT